MRNALSLVSVSSQDVTQVVPLYTLDLSSLGLIPDPTMKTSRQIGVSQAGSFLAEVRRPSDGR